jgi:hypothetical protein
MNDAQFADLAAWISNAGLGGRDETAMTTEFCARLVAHGLPLVRAQVFIDTLHPIYSGRLYSWQVAKGETTATEYGPVSDGEALARWQQSAFYHLLETGFPALRRRLTKESGAEFPLLGELHAIGMTEYVAIVDRFGADAVIGEMDCVYSSWTTDASQGFTEAHASPAYALSRARHQIGNACPHRQDPGRNISRARSRQTRAERQHRAGNLNVNRSGPLVQHERRSQSLSALGSCPTGYPAPPPLGCPGTHFFVRGIELNSKR